MRGGFLDMTLLEWLSPLILLVLVGVFLAVAFGLTAAAIHFCFPKPSPSPRRRLSKIVGQDGRPLIVEDPSPFCKPNREQE